MPIWAVNRYRYDRSRPQLAVTPFCAEAIAFATDERLLKLEVCIILLGRIGLREILWRLARNRLGDRWQIGARPSPDIGCAASVLQHMV